VNGVFDNFRALSGGKLSCCFYNRVMQLIIDTLNKRFETYIHSDTLSDFLDKVETIVDEYLATRKENFMDDLRKDSIKCTSSMEESTVLHVKGEDSVKVVTILEKQ
jgi:hypothetical protein